MSNAKIIFNAFLNWLCPTVIFLFFLSLLLAGCSKKAIFIVYEKGGNKAAYKGKQVNIFKVGKSDYIFYRSKFIKVK